METQLKQHRGLIEHTLKKYYPECKYGASKEDYRQLGQIGLWRALQTYDESKKGAFSTWAVFQIRGAITSGLRAYGHSEHDHLKGRWNHSTFSDIMGPNGPKFENGVGGVVSSEALRKEELSDAQKTLNKYIGGLDEGTKRILLEHCKGKSFQKIADEMGIPMQKAALIYRETTRKLRVLALRLKKRKNAV